MSEEWKKKMNRKLAEKPKLAKLYDQLLKNYP